jgi:hypothetical protein
MPARSALLLLILLDSACAAGVLPPSRTEIGSTVIAGSGQVQNGLRVATGAHLASGQTARDGNIDLGAGFVYERLGAAAASEARVRGAAPPEEGAPTFIEASGSYADAAAVLQRGRWHRTWIGARTELMRQRGAEGGRAVGASFARIAWETYAPVHGSGSFSDGSGAFGAGFAHGAFAMGLFVESGVRYAEGERPAFVAIGGMSLRMPWLGGFVFDPKPR